MTDDMEFLQSVSKNHRVISADGTVQEITLDQSFHRVNNAMTKAFDTIFFGSPDQTDAFDASCNTCVHFQRKAMSPEEKRERNVFGMPGRCAKKAIAVVAWHRGIFCGDENGACYENRRTGQTYPPPLKEAE